MCRSLVLCALVACKPAADDVVVTTLPVLGDGTNDIAGMLEVRGGAPDGLDRAQDLAFNPEVNGELWVVSRADDSVTIYDDAGTPDQVATWVQDPYALHFMEQVSSIAFGAPGTFATCQDSRNTYNGGNNPNNFMGPTLWSSDRSIFGISNPAAIDEVGGDLGSHLDMLHESPQCMGITWDHDNVYWVFDGLHSSINRYDFKVDHGVGYDDHCDGDIQRWTGLDVARVPGVVSHLVLDHDTGLLYIADTGNGRIAVLDTASGTRGSDLSSVEDGACQANYGKPGPEHYRWEGGAITTLVSGLAEPAGLELIDGTLFVTEHGTGHVRAFDLDGTELDWAATGRAGALQGIYATSLGELWMVDGEADEILRVQGVPNAARSSR
jgi:DNA-binding beta-propeller fold protein YncE